MATYRDAALAEYQLRHDTWIAKGRDRLVPLMTDSTGKVVLDAYTKTTVAHEDAAAGLVVFTTTDGSNISFAVWPDSPGKAVRITTQGADGLWTMGAEVQDLDDVGAVLAGAA